MANVSDTLAEFLAARHEEDERAGRDPAHVNAMRQIVIEHTPTRPEYLPHRERGCTTCSTAQAWDTQANEALCRTLRILSLPYAAHADYRETWRP